MIPLAGGVPLAIAVLSYRDVVSFGITGDYDAMPNVSGVADGILTALDELRT